MSERDFPYSSNLRRFKMPASRLKLGMYVAELDRPWLGTPFLVQGFIIESQDQLSTLMELCEHVYIDPRLSRAPAGTLAGAAAKNPTSQAVRARPHGGSGLPPGVSEQYAHYGYQIQEELSRAQSLHGRALQLVAHVHRQAKTGAALDLHPLRALAAEFATSLSRNADALLWMTHVKHRAHYHTEHAVNCGILAMTFGRSLSLEKVDIENWGLCGLLFDIGKMRLPPDLLDKAGPYDEVERRTMQQHVALGEQLVRNSNFPTRFLRDAVTGHHLRPDGRGYPPAVERVGVSRTARVMAIVDAYDAMTSERSYAAARTHADALRELYLQRERQFDGPLVATFMQLVGPYPAGTLVQLRNGLCGVSIGSGYKARHLPTVVLLRDSVGGTITPRLVDLTTVEKGALSQDYLVQLVLGNGHFGIDLEDPELITMLSGSPAAG